ncbi:MULTISPECIES: LysR family transcriptional regulator [Acinetobacter]|mgnify:CR=1 FL=1|uniref:LysR family transcriptional regulator n=1 Tax=Acinetobacter faecalis TaxID=2665161 RepID=A0A6L6GC51_9GAMM|nr:MULTISPECIES: LysR family transcriptional regulator [Acinetobacter]MDY6450750.1 LysR family transcriptional regulator [Acinetobacter faecalis]MDY6456034.1 LysR family transcriptional regulator [Acinetobacter faecalis]MDY6458482.1 LysR family transcriptional regulator [Acinetobacter faecalis]MDY6460586.1 LysR family transcriptional regulator [Acinetobacter faecalis]MDY6468563.1 LysR family transcriptional regulator [Acinetobacter faecalis]
MFELDCKVLNVFLYIYKYKSVSVAAEHLGMNQPTVSNILNRVRQHYNDPLFLRIGNEMVPTELSKQLFPLISEALNKVETINNFNVAFDQATSQQQFTLAMTDVSHLVLLPKISQYLKTHAPNIRLNVRQITTETTYQMANGEIDLALGFLPHLENGFYQQKLFEQYYVVIASKNHPRLNDVNITTEQYLKESHIDIDAGIGHYHIENELLNLDLKRNILMRLPSYLGVGLVVQETDAIATVPYYLSEVLLSRGNLQIFNAPISFPTYAVKQYWHMSCHHKTSHQWLRKMLHDILVK